MNKHTRRALFRALYVVAISLSFLLPAMPQSAKAYSGGITGVSQSGCTCHTSSTATTVTMQGVGTSLTVGAGSTTSFTAIVAHSTKPKAGINISVKNGSNSNVGTLSPVGGALKSLAGELTHNNAPIDISGGQALFTFDFTAPTAPGTYTMYASGNAVTVNGNTSDDFYRLLNGGSNITINVKGVTVTSPNGGENICQNSNHSITWTSAHITNVKIEYSTNGSSWNTIIASTSASAGSYSWTASQAPGTTYLIKVSDASDANTADQSDATFSIVAGPAITEHPIPLDTVCTGLPKTFSVTATGTNLTYQWRKGGSNIGGATQSTYSIASVAAGDAATYDCRVTGCSQTVTSNGSVLVTRQSPIVTTHPKDTLVCIGQSATFTVAVTGTGLTYQWRRNSSNISGQTGTTYNIASVTAADTGTIDVVITSSCATPLTSNPAQLSLRKPVISAHPASIEACVGSPASLSVNATGQSLSYVWRKNGTPVSGQTTNTLNIASLTLSDTATYDVVVTSACSPQSVTSQPAQISIPAFSISTQPTSVAVCQGRPAQLSVTAAGLNVTYNWRKNGVATGTTTAVLSIAAASNADTGTYTCVIMDQCARTLTTVPVTISLASPVITKQPRDTSIVEGGKLTLVVDATGSGLSYQWQKGGTNISGATSATFEKENVVTGDAGAYRCVVSNTCGPFNSSVAQVTIVGAGQPILSVSTDSIGFECVAANGDRTVTLPTAISNTGGAPLNISSVVVVGSGQLSFTVLAPTAPVQIAAGAFVPLSVKFTANTQASYNASITITWDGNKTKSIALHGELCPPSGGFGPLTFNLGKTDISDELDSNFTLINSGGDATVTALTIQDATSGGTFFVDAIGGELPLQVPAQGELQLRIRFSAPAPGTYTATLALSTATEVYPISLTVVVNEPGSVEDVSVAGFRVYPQPVADGFTIDAPENRPILRAQLSDLTGRVVAVQQSAAPVQSMRMMVNGKSQLTAGLYILSITTPTGVVVTKVMVQ